MYRRGEGQVQVRFIPHFALRAVILDRLAKFLLAHAANNPGDSLGHPCSVQPQPDIIPRRREWIEGAGRGARDRSVAPGTAVGGTDRGTKSRTRAVAFGDLHGRKKHLLEAQMQVALTCTLVAIPIAENAEHPRVANRT